MFAFYKTTENKAFKAYDIDGVDWQIMCPDGTEHWYSQWRGDINGSLLNAFKKATGNDELTLQDIIIIPK